MNAPKSEPQRRLQRAPTIAPRVLILESDRLIQQLILEWLQMAGFETLCASDAASAAHVAVGACDVMLADIPAPLASARASVQRLSRAMPNTPIIAMSADVLSVSRTASDAIARELGVAAVLVKPFTQSALLQTIRRARAQPRYGCNRSGER